ncbi:MAG: type II toxin-antitoxin system HicA family toxin [Chloroflexi bacterium]|nr:type II toxin-antitoxin system HicA family toxin [Chloroflexota bacterium]
MPAKLPALRATAIVRALERSGFVVKRQTGSHMILTRSGLRRPIVIPMHRRELPPATVKDIIRQAGISIDEFIQNL